YTRGFHSGAKTLHTEGPAPVSGGCRGREAGAVPTARAAARIAPRASFRATGTARAAIRGRASEPRWRARAVEYRASAAPREGGDLRAAAAGLDALLADLDRQLHLGARVEGGRQAPDVTLARGVVGEDRAVERHGGVLDRARRVDHPVVGVEEGDHLLGGVAEPRAVHEVDGVGADRGLVPTGRRVRRRRRGVRAGSAGCQERDQGQQRERRAEPPAGPRRAATRV